MTYFELFDIPVSFLPDQKKLKQKFYELSRKYHPDFFTQENEFEQSEALETSSLINKAYKTFQNKDEIIKYILQLKGLLEEEEKYQLSPGFLMDMMELNEQLSDAKMEGDPASITALKKTIDDKEKEIYQPVKTIIESYKEGITVDNELLKVKDYYFKKKYLRRILASLL